MNLVSLRKDKPMNNAHLHPILALVGQILALKQRDPHADITALESELDKLVVELYRHRV